MLVQNILTILALALSVSARPRDTSCYPSYGENGISAVAHTTTSAPSRTLTRGSDGHAPTSTTSTLVLSSGITSSGNDGDGNQNVGNSGQNSGNGAASSGTIGGDYTVEQATTTCGNAQLNCCNKTVKKGDTTNAGLIGALFGSGDLGVQCSPINLPIIGIQVPINKACDAKAACCQGDTPCRVALSILVALLLRRSFNSATIPAQ